MNPLYVKIYIINSGKVILLIFHHFIIKETKEYDRHLGLGIMLKLIIYFKNVTFHVNKSQSKRKALK